LISYRDSKHDSVAMSSIFIMDDWSTDTCEKEKKNNTVIANRGIIKPLVCRPDKVVKMYKISLYKFFTHQHSQKRKKKFERNFYFFHWHPALVSSIIFSNSLPLLRISLSFFSSFLLLNINWILISSTISLLGALYGTPGE